MIVLVPETWKALIASHSSTEEATNKTFHFIADAFDKDNSVIECTTAALGIAPGIFMALPLESQKPILFHHFSKAFRHPGVSNDVDEFYGILSWDNLPLAVKVDPANLFTLAWDGTVDIERNLKTYFADIDTNQLFTAAHDPVAFHQFRRTPSRAKNCS